MRVPLPSIRAACDEAANHGVPVTAHLELVDADPAIRAGVAGMEHITSFGTALADPSQAERFRAVVTADSDARPGVAPDSMARDRINRQPAFGTVARSDRRTECLRLADAGHL